MKEQPFSERLERMLEQKQHLDDLCSKMLARLVEVIPLESLVTREVKMGRSGLDESHLDEFFGEPDEAGGSPVADGHTIDTLLFSQRELAERIAEFLRPSDSVKDRLEYLRGEIEAERISYEEIAELQSLADHIDEDDVQLLAWASDGDDERSESAGSSE